MLFNISATTLQKAYILQTPVSQVSSQLFLIKESCQHNNTVSCCGNTACFIQWHQACREMGFLKLNQANIWQETFQYVEASSPEMGNEILSPCTFWNMPPVSSSNEDYYPLRCHVSTLSTQFTLIIRRDGLLMFQNEKCILGLC